MVRLRRGRGEIVLSILEAALTGDKKTNIMYRANLSYRTFNFWFRRLLEAGFLEGYEDSDGDKAYRTSDAGKALLKMGRGFYDLLDRIVASGRR